MTRKLEFRVMPSSIIGAWDVMSREVPTSANRTPNWSLTSARDATEIGEAILEEVGFRTVTDALVPIEDQPPAEAGHERCDLSTCRICDAVELDRVVRPLPDTPEVSP